MKTIRPSITWIVSLIAFASTPLCFCQQSGAASPAPVPSQILTAKKVFISNAGGEELDPRQFFVPTVDSDEAYKRFYAAIQNSGRFALAPTPSEGDLVLEIRFSEVLAPGHVNTGDAASPHLRLRILDPKTHTLLWALVERVEAASGPHWKDKRQANFQRGITALAAEMMALTSAQPSPVK